MLEVESSGHTPVLPRQVCDLLGVRCGDVVVDATVGLAGHAALLAQQLGPEGVLVGLDVDPANLAIAKETLAACEARVELVHANFAELPDALAGLNLPRVDVLLADLGVSSTQLDDGARGFSFQHDGPLDMRMDPRLKVTASDLVNGLKENDLSDVLYRNAQEFASRRIAKRICNVRRDGRITTTARLVRIICDALHIADPNSRRSRIHPATRTFLGLRMAVNEEIANLAALLKQAPSLLAPGGRIGIIAFHSVEDRAVKIDFRERKKEEIYQLTNKRPIVAEADERAANPRSRSAKLRVAVRL